MWLLLTWGGSGVPRLLPVDFSHPEAFLSAFAAAVHAGRHVWVYHAQGQQLTRLYPPLPTQARVRAELIPR